jgi:hypothetical protein
MVAAKWLRNRDALVDQYIITVILCAVWKLCVYLHCYWKNFMRIILCIITFHNIQSSHKHYIITVIYLSLMSVFLWEEQGLRALYYQGNMSLCMSTRWVTTAMRQYSLLQDNIHSWTRTRNLHAVILRVMLWLLILAALKTLTEINIPFRLWSFGLWCCVVFCVDSRVSEGFAVAQSV